MIEEQDLTKKDEVKDGGVLEALAVMLFVAKADEQPTVEATMSDTANREIALQQWRELGAAGRRAYRAEALAMAGQLKLAGVEVRGAGRGAALKAFLEEAVTIPARPAYALEEAVYA